MKRVVFHIGLHKTGTSLLQDFFLRAEEELSTEHGVRFPLAGRAPERRIIHSNLAWEELGHGSFNPALGTVEQAIEEIRQGDATRWLISTEGLSRLTEPASWLGRFSEFHRTVVMYSRSPREYLPSRYTEELKAGSRSDFASWLRTKGVAVGDHQRVASRWFGAADGLILRKFVPERLLEGDLVSDFFEALGIDVGPTLAQHPTARGGPMNARMSHFACLCVYLWNVVNPYPDDPQPIQVDRRRAIRARAEKELPRSTLGAGFEARHPAEVEALCDVLVELGEDVSQLPVPMGVANASGELERAVEMVLLELEAVTGKAAPGRAVKKLRRRGRQFLGLEP